MKFKECEHCGAHLDHGEICDCNNQEVKQNLHINRRKNITKPEQHIHININIEVKK